MLIYPLFRLSAPTKSGLAFIVEGNEIVTNPNIEVTFKNANGDSFNLDVMKRVLDGVMYVHASPPLGASVFGTGTGGGGGGGDGGIGSITVTVTGTSHNITAQVGYGDPGAAGAPPSPTTPA